MAEAIKFDIDGRDGRKFWRLLMRASDPSPALHEFGSYKVDEIKGRFQRGPLSAMALPGAAPVSRTGGRGIVGSITYLLRGILLRVGTSKVYGAILQFGGVVKARGKLLTIPVHPSARGKRARDIPDLDYVPVHRYPVVGLLVKLMGRGKREARTMFILAKKVKIRPHPYLEWTRRDFNYLWKALQRLFERS